MTNVQYYSIKIINCSYEIYPIKLHVLFTHAAKILHSHEWPDNLHRTQNFADWRIRAPVLAALVQPFYMSRGTNKRFAWWKSWMAMRRNLKEIVEKRYAHCPGVFEDIKPFTTTWWNIFFKITDIFKLKTGILRCCCLSMFNNNILILLKCKIYINFDTFFLVDDISIKVYIDDSPTY